MSTTREFFKYRTKSQNSKGEAHSQLPKTYILEIYNESLRFFVVVAEPGFSLNPPSTKEFFFEFFNHFSVQYSLRPPKYESGKKFFFLNRKYPFQVWTKTSRWYLQGYGSPTFLFIRILLPFFDTYYRQGPTNNTQNKKIG